MTTVERLASRLRELGRDETAEQTGRLGSTIEAAHIAISDHCGRQVMAYPQVVGYSLWGDGGRRVFLQQWPIVAIESVTLAGEPVAERRGLSGQGYVPLVWLGVLELVGGMWTKDAHIVVKARCGYDAETAKVDRRHARALEALDRACLLLCCAVLVGPGRVRCEQPKGWPAEVLGLLEPHRREARPGDPFLGDGTPRARQMSLSGEEA